MLPRHEGRFYSGIASDERLESTARPLRRQDHSRNELHNDRASLL